MLYAELGCKPIAISIKNRMIGYWLNIINSKNSKLSNLLYNILLHEYNAGIFQHKWIHCIREILISVGRIDLFNKVNVENTKSLKAQISRALVDLHIQEWFSKIELSSKGKNYYLFKQDLNFENYLINLSTKHYGSLLKFRLSNHRLPVETGHWENTPLDEWKCNLCPKNDIGDEFHYLFTCDYTSIQIGNSF